MLCSVFAEQGRTAYNSGCSILKLKLIIKITSSELISLSCDFNGVNWGILHIWTSVSNGNTGRCLLPAFPWSCSGYFAFFPEARWRGSCSSSPRTAGWSLSGSQPPACAGGLPSVASSSWWGHFSGTSVPCFCTSGCSSGDVPEAEDRRDPFPALQSRGLPVCLTQVTGSLQKGLSLLADLCCWQWEQYKLGSLGFQQVAVP